MCLPDILKMFGQKRSPEAIYSRRSLVENQIKWLTEKNISSEIFSAAEDLRTVDGNLYLITPKNPEDEKTYYVNSSHFLVQANEANRITSARIKAFKAKKAAESATYDEIRHACISLHIVVCKRNSRLSSAGILEYYWTYSCIGCLGFQVYVNYVYTSSINYLVGHFVLSIVVLLYCWLGVRSLVFELDSS